MRKWVFGAWVLLGSSVPLAPLAGAESAWTVEPESTVGFVATQAGANVEGRFETFTAEINFDPQNLESNKVMVEIDIASVNSESKERDDAIRADGLFDVATWPIARFETTSFEKQNLWYLAHGKLTLRDVTQDVTLPFQLTITDDNGGGGQARAKATGELKVNRLDYGVGQGIWRDTSVVGNEVIIRIDIRASRGAD